MKCKLCVFSFLLWVRNLTKYLGDLPPLCLARASWRWGKEVQSIKRVSWCLILKRSCVRSIPNSDSESPRHWGYLDVRTTGALVQCLVEVTLMTRFFFSSSPSFHCLVQGMRLAYEMSTPAWISLLRLECQSVYFMSEPEKMSGAEWHPAALRCIHSLQSVSEATISIKLERCCRVQKALQSSKKNYSIFSQATFTWNTSYKRKREKKEYESDKIENIDTKIVRRRWAYTVEALTHLHTLRIHRLTLRN